MLKASLMVLMFAVFGLGANMSPGGLSGKVSSQAEGAMEGVLVGAATSRFPDQRVGGEQCATAIYVSAGAIGAGQLARALRSNASGLPR